MELARFSFFSTGGVKSHSFIAQLNCKWFHELLLLLLFTVVLNFMNHLLYTIIIEPNDDM
jgi:hypothetical protein